MELDRYKNKPRVPRIYKISKERFEKLTKKDGPAPGSYHIEEAIMKSQWVKKSMPVDKSTASSFID